MADASVFERVTGWFRSTPRWIGDASLTAVFAVVGLLSTGGPLAEGAAIYKPRDWFAYVCITVAIAPFLVLRRWPFAVMVVSALGVVVLSASGYREGLLPTFLLLACWTVGVQCSGRLVVLA